MNRYTRMFPQLARPPATAEIECGLTKLGKKMCRKPEDDERENAAVTLTYIGQMMDHDLTFDITPLRQAHPHEDRIQNFRTPLLNLEFLYGGGPTVSPFLYDRKCGRGEECFLVGKTRNCWPKKRSDNDLPRNLQGIALVGDPREDENLIVAQLHVFFLKWHNRLLEDLQAGTIQNVGPAGASKFEQARRLLTWSYQKSFAIEFVKRFVDESVFKAIRDEFTPTSFWGRRFRIPIEFSVAAFRFGHSIVRDSYDYNKYHSPAKLFELLKQTGMGGGACPRLKENWVVGEGFFARNLGQEIRPRIARDLFKLPQSAITLFNIASGEETRTKCDCDASDNPESMLPVRTLLRGARMGLPSGQDVAKALGISDAVITDALGQDLSGDLVNTYHFHEDTPLWYYILKEAELLGTLSENGEGGKKLGPVGSWIVAATVFGALRADPNSYLSIDPLWRPTAVLSNLFAPLFTSSVSDSAASVGYHGL